MNNIFRTIAGKVILFFVCLISVTALLFSILTGALMLDSGFYNRNETDVYRDLVRSDIGQKGEDALWGVLYEFEPWGMDNLQYILKDTASGTILAASKDILSTEGAPQKWDFAIGYQYDPEYNQIYWNIFNSAAAYTGEESFNSLFAQEWGYSFDTFLRDLAAQKEWERMQDEAIYAQFEIEEYAEDEWREETAEIKEEAAEAGSIVTSDTADRTQVEEPAQTASEESLAASTADSAADSTAPAPDAEPLRVTYMFFANVNTAFPGAMDNFKIYYDLVHFAFSLRFYLLYIIGASLVLSIVSFILLMLVTARRRKDNELHPGFFYKAPGDLLLFGYVILFCFLFIFLEEFDSMLGYLFSALWGIVLIALTLGLCMNYAAKIKGHCFWKTTLIGRFCHLIASTFSRIRILPRLSLLLLGIAFVQFMVLLLTRSGEYMVFWILECMVLVPLVLYFAGDLKDLENAGKRMASGDFSQKINPQKLLPFLRPHAQALNSLGEGMTIAVENQLRSERMKTELITNVSHDLKTPLTSIINYANLISKEPTDNEKITEYSDVLVRQSTKLKRLIEDLVEASKAATGNLDVELSPCDASVFVEQSAGEFEDRLASSSLTLITSLPKEEVKIMADGRRMWRIFDNLMNNACKYALPGTRVYLSLEKYNQNAVIIFKNISKEPLNMSEEALMERFTRGDSSRNTEGNGLGLSIAKSMAELQNGHLHVSIDGDLFKATLLFPLIDPAVQDLTTPAQAEATDPDFDFRPLP